MGFSLSTPLSISASTLVVVMGAMSSWVSQESCPSARCRCLDGGSIMACQRARLTNVPRVLTETLILDLDQNRISRIQNGSFRSGCRLEMVSLQDNGLLHLEPDVFAELRELRILRLGRNHLSSIPENLFRNNRRLLVLDLHGNYLTGLPDGALSHVHSLQSINVSFNQLTTVAMGQGFRFTTQLSIIDLSGNDLVSLESTSFSGANSWDEQVERHINLSYCNLRFIHPSTFHAVPFLSTLSLQGNPRLSEKDVREALKGAYSTPKIINLSHLNISDVRATFVEYQPRALIELYLSYNRIGSVPKQTFLSMENLRRLDLSHNEISVLQSLTELSRLESLDLSYNDLDRLDDTVFDGLHDLKVLDLSRNSLVELGDGPFLKLFSLRYIDLSHNHIELLSFQHSLETVETLLATRNRISSVRFLQALRQLRHLDLSQNTITRLEEELFSRRNHRCLSVNFSNNAIHRIAETAFRFSSFDYVDLSRNRLTTLDYYGWENIRRLYASENVITEVTRSALSRSALLQDLQLHTNHVARLPSGAFDGLLRLKTLDLSANPIGEYLERGNDVIELSERIELLRLRRTGLSAVPSKLLQNLTFLRVLDLAQNRIEHIDETSFSHLTKLRDLNLAKNSLRDLPSNLLAQTSSLKNLDLSDNVLDCSCKLISTLGQLLSPSGGTVRIVNLHNRSSYKCHSRERWTGTYLEDFYSQSSTSCLTLNLSSASSTLRRIAVAVSVVVAAVVVVITVVVVVVIIQGCRRTDCVSGMVRGRRRTRLQGTARYECVSEENSKAIDNLSRISLSSSSSSRKMEEGESRGAEAAGGAHERSQDESKVPIVLDSKFSPD